MEFVLERLQARQTQLERDFARDVAEPLGMEWRITPAAERKRVALLASRDDHCLLDLLWRWRRGNWPRTSSPYSRTTRTTNPMWPRSEFRTTSSPSRPAARRTRRRAYWSSRRQSRPRGARPLHADPLARRPGATHRTPVINIDHSFLPAFVGADPYRRAHESGVKIIGATAHYYAVEELDAGPIIEQDVARISHRETVEDLVRSGRAIERVVLARAVAVTWTTACSSTRTGRSSSSAPVRSGPTSRAGAPGRKTDRRPRSRGSSSDTRGRRWSDGSCRRRRGRRPAV